MRPKVFVSRALPEEGLKLLRKHCDVEVNPHDRVLNKDEIIQGIQGKDALLCLLTDPINAEILDANKNLRVVSNYAVGFNNIDVQAANDRQIPVTNTPGVLTDTVADHAMAMMMAIARRIPEADRYTKEGKYQGWAPMLFLGTDVYEKTLGILGMGRIGQAVAKRASMGFGMKIVYFDVARNKDIEKKYGAKFGTVEEVLKASDFVTVHVPLLPQTKHLISVKELNMMKNTAYLINTSRGPVVDEEALVHALRHNVIAGAALDVLEDEPALKPGLAELDNAITTPHIASATNETRGAMAVLAVENLLAVIEGKNPKHQVNKDAVKIGKGFKHPFHWAHGLIKNKQELENAIKSMSDNDYAHHVNEHKNDFANWVHDVLGDKALAEKLKKSTSRLGASRAFGTDKKAPAKKPAAKKPVKKTKVKKKK